MHDVVSRLPSASDEITHNEADDQRAYSHAHHRAHELVQREVVIVFIAALALQPIADLLCDFLHRKSAILQQTLRSIFISLRKKRRD